MTSFYHSYCVNCPYSHSTVYSLWHDSRRYIFVIVLFSRISLFSFVCVLLFSVMCALDVLLMKATYLLSSDNIGNKVIILW